MNFAPAHRATLVFCLALALAIPSTALASSYYTSFNFKFHLIGANRSYDGNSVAISATASSSQTYPSTYRVTLHRYYNPLYYPTIGYSDFPVNGYKSVAWTNVGSGTYYFDFIKADNGLYVSSNNVHMWSY